MMTWRSFCLLAVLLVHSVNGKSSDELPSDFVEKSHGHTNNWAVLVDTSRYIDSLIAYLYSISALDCSLVVKNHSYHTVWMAWTHAIHKTNVKAWCLLFACLCLIIQASLFYQERNFEMFRKFISNRGNPFDAWPVSQS